jgi:hypothetical protein
MEYPKVIQATEIKGDWIDPYKSKRLKNKKALERRLVKREQELMKEPESEDEIEDKPEVQESLWDES